LFNSNKLSSKDKAVLNNDVLPVLSACLRHRGELANKTLEAVIYLALKEMLPNANQKATLDTDAHKLLSNQQIYDEVYKLADGSPIADKKYAFYSVEYGEVSEKKILKICRDKFFAKDDSIGRDGDKQRALAFDEKIVSKVGSAFNIVTEIKILEPEPDGQNRKMTMTMISGCRGIMMSNILQTMTMMIA
jgi:hypothetical protein